MTRRPNPLPAIVSAARALGVALTLCASSIFAADEDPVALQAVALQIKAKDKVTAPRADAIVFGAPAGDGRNGALGVLLRNHPSTGNDGSTWSFDYVWTESANGMQIFHPKGRGQAIVNLSSTGVGLCTPKTWREVGYKVYDLARVKRTPAFREIFPLQAGRSYAVISTLHPGGKYELAIDGQIVAKGRVSTTYPLSLELDPKKKFPGAGRVKLEWTGAGLPMQWSSGYAALLVEPTDTSPNLCRNIFFTPAAVDISKPTPTPEKAP